MIIPQERENAILPTLSLSGQCVQSFDPLDMAQLLPHTADKTQYFITVLH